MRSNHEIHAYVRILYYKGDMVNTKQKTKKTKNTKNKLILNYFLYKNSSDISSLRYLVKIDNMNYHLF